MDQKTFDALVARLEPYAERHPSAYTWRVALLVLGGYAYLLATLVVLVALIGGLLWNIRNAGAAVKFLIPLAALAWVIARSLWVRRTLFVSLGRRNAPLRRALASVPGALVFSA